MVLVEVEGVDGGGDEASIVEDWSLHCMSERMFVNIMECRKSPQCVLYYKQVLVNNNNL